MRDLARNQITIGYKLLSETVEITDEYGNKTGSFTKVYGNEQSIKMSVSANKGDYDIQQFGNLLDYDRVMITSDVSCEIDESAMIYIDTEEYAVKAVARSINVVKYAIKRVDVS